MADQTVPFKLDRLAAPGSLNEQLAIWVQDHQGPGGAHHGYLVTDARDGELKGGMRVLGKVTFQEGGVAENGVNGISNEVLLEIVRHRLVCFQAGPFACQGNADALVDVESALAGLYARTADRVDRGVEGRELP